MGSSYNSWDIIMVTVGHRTQLGHTFEKAFAEVHELSVCVKRLLHTYIYDGGGRPQIQLGHIH